MKTRQELVEELEATTKKLIATTWRTCGLTWAEIKRWLEQFDMNAAIQDDEQIHALYLLTHFLYFDQDALRVLLKSVFRDLYRTPILHTIRRDNADTLDQAFLEQRFSQTLEQTRFLGVGNPSESGVHLLYYFRQENALKKTLFINTHEIFRSVRDNTNQVSIKIRVPSIRRYVFIDDVCGSGTQARDYLRDEVEALKALDPSVKASYFVLFATPAGLTAVRGLNCFDEVEAVFELDESFKCLEPTARIFNPPAAEYDRAKVRATCHRHGTSLWSTHPLGYKDGQMLLGFSHNTPDNTLPIFWMQDDQWFPVFKRYHKDYG